MIDKTRKTKKSTTATRARVVKAAPKAKSAPKAKPAAKAKPAPKAKTDAKAAVLRPGRLIDKVALVTGAAGNIGEVIVRRYLEEGAKVVMVGRNAAKLEATRATLLAETGAPAENALALAFDASDAGQARHGVETLIRHFGRLDIVVNNAGSAGPKGQIENLPLSREDLAALQATGSTDSETVADAAGNLLGLSWNVVRAAAPHLRCTPTPRKPRVAMAKTA